MGSARLPGDFFHPDLRMREIEWHEEIRRVPWDRDMLMEVAHA